MSDFTVLDIETTGEFPWRHQMVACGIGTTVHRGEAHGSSAWLEKVAKLVSDPEQIIVAHTNYDLRWTLLKMREEGMDPVLRARYHDTKVMAFMLDQSQMGELSLDALAQKYLGAEPLSKPICMREGRVMYDCTKGMGFCPDLGIIPIEDVPWSEMHEYNMQDLVQTADLYRFLREELQHRGFWDRYFISEEAPLSSLLVEMEVTGMPIDPEGAHELLAKADGERQKLAAQLVEWTGACCFNLKSGDQVADFLYDELPTFKVQAEVPGLLSLAGPKHAETRMTLAQEILPDNVRLTRVGTKYAYGFQTVDGLGINPPKMKGKKGKEPKRPPIDAENLVLINRNLPGGENPWIAMYLRWKSLNTLCTNYLEKWTDVEHKGRLHGRFDQARTETGRIASRDPNLQAIPVSDGSDVRRLFRAPLMIGDYSGLDARVAAHFSEDPVMLDIFRHNRDLYGTLASNAWGGPATKKNDNRSLMKILMLSSQYGAQAGSIGDKMRIAGFSEKECRQSGKLLRDMEEVLSRMFEWREEVLAEAIANGYVTTITGRKRYLPDLYSDEWWRKARAERQCVASQVQGTSADIVRRAMVKVREAIPPEVAKMVLQVHDEILWERGPEWYDDAFEEIVNICQTAHEEDFFVPATGQTLPGFPLQVPMKFEASLGISWEEKDAQGARSYRIMSGG